jgi:hypothetical protein
MIKRSVLRWQQQSFDHQGWRTAVVADEVNSSEEADVT